MLKLVGKTSSYTLEKNNPDFVLKQSGKFGKTLIARDLNGKRVVIKQVSRNQKNSEAGLSAIVREIKYTPDSPYFLKPTDFFEINNTVYLVRPFVEGVSLKDLLNEKFLFNQLTFNQKLLIAKEVLKGLRQLEELGIIHRDIRPSNILLKNYEEFLRDNVSPQIAIIDFGLAQRLGEVFPEDYRFPFALIYAPPEQLLNLHELVGHYSDIYAWAITFYEFFTGEKPWYSDNPEFLMNLQLNFPLPENDKLNTEFFEILKRASNKKPLGKPPAMLSRKQLSDLVRSGIDERFKTTTHVLEELNRLNLEVNSNETGSANWFKRIIKNFVV